MQPCPVCGAMAVDQNGYCAQCGTFRGQVPQPVSGPGYQYGQPPVSAPPPASGPAWPSQTSAAPYPFSGPLVSGTPGYPPPPQQRRALTPILIAASALVVILVGAIVVVAIARSGKSGTPQANSSSANTGPNAAIDPCLVGTWKATSEHQTQDLPGVGPVTMTGQGDVTHVHPDGTINDDYSQSSPYTGAYSGHSITMTVTGSATSKATTANGTLTFHDMQADGTVSFAVDGQQVGSSIPLSLSNDPVQYTCLTKTATLHTDHFDVTLSKISDSP
jgi:hypothetical protein